jgi:hypothetical protein
VDAIQIAIPAAGLKAASAETADPGNRRSSNFFPTLCIKAFCSAFIADSTLMLAFVGFVSETYDRFCKQVVDGKNWVCLEARRQPQKTCLAAGRTTLDIPINKNEVFDG